MDENQPLAQLTAEVLTPVVQQWLVTHEDDGRRLDAFLSAYVEKVTRREIREWLATGNARVNGRVSAKGSRVRSGDTVTLTTFAVLRPNPDLPIRILWADEAIVVLDKPSGIPSIALRHNETETVANFLLARFPETATASPRPLEAGVAHRLDTATSGVLLVARTTQAYDRLREQFRNRTVEKQYLALVHGQLLQPGTRRSFLIPTGRRGQGMRETTVGSGQEAQTDYVPVTQFLHHTLLRVTIPTGVRHQIRVHLAALGHPIVGDVMYGEAPESERLCLHAESLSFIHPGTGGRVQFTCPLPEDFQAVQDRVTNTKSIS